MVPGWRSLAFLGRQQELPDHGNLTMTRRNLFTICLNAVGVVAGVAVIPKLAAAGSQDKLALADVNVKELLLLMDADKNGKISKKEWMSFMEAEFNKLDRNGDGELDQEELQVARISARSSRTAVPASNQ